MMNSKLDSMIEPAVVALGFEYVGSEWLAQTGQGNLLRVYVDSENGVSVGDCADLSRQIGAILDVEDPFKQNSTYRLEVSSPGLNRPLFMLRHFSAVVGQNIQCRLHVAQNGRRHFKGILTAVDGDLLHLTIDNEVFVLNFHDINKANVVFDF